MAGSAGNAPRPGRCGGGATGRDSSALSRARHVCIPERAGQQLRLEDEPMAAAMTTAVTAGAGAGVAGAEAAEGPLGAAAALELWLSE